MAKYNVVLDIGSQFISAGLLGDISVKMPAVLAMENKQVVAFGVKALNMSKSGNSNAKLVTPFLEGAVVDAENAKLIILEILKRILPNKAKVFAEMKVCCVVHCGMTAGDKKTLENILLTIGAKSVYFLATPLADSTQLFREFLINRAVIVDIGHECTDVAVVYGDQIVAGCTLFHSGKTLTKSISELVKRKYLVQLPDEQAELLKINCASLYENDTSNFSVSGVNLQTGKYENLSIAAKEIYDTAVEFSKVFCKVVESLLNSVPEQISNAVRQTGVLLCGGGAKLLGLDSFLTQQLALTVHTASDPQEVSILGAMARPPE